MASREVLEEFTIEMFWKCRHCGQKNPGLSGAEDESLKCSKCGAQKSDEKWLMPENLEEAPRVTDPEKLRRADAGANWTCRFCKNEERDLHDACSVCGASRKNEALNAPRAVPEKPETKRPPSPSAVPAREKPKAAALALLRFRPARRHVFIFVGGMGGLVLLIWLFVWLFGTRETNARVESVAWRVTERIRERTIVHGAGWRSGMPSGAYHQSCERRQDGWERCHPRDCNCHPETYDCRCRGGESYSCRCTTEVQCTPRRNGSASCRRVRSCDTCTTPRRCDTCTRTACDTCYDRCPTYADWCSYDEDTWPIVRTETTRGVDLNVRFPGLVAVRDDQRFERDESYQAIFTDGARHWTYRAPSLADFRRFPVGIRYRINYNRAGLFRPLYPLSRPTSVAESVEETFR